ncbi:MAG TPA: RdgB/HAM1 family non-canonical purine NTP pyrophosphatase [Candidatus Acidoferrales bacterium]|nr:RdgB/HAM1 family non-canonical purine NTP pyrophosphatase [Candidatus Acidoferrales bacterium]
MRAPVKLFLASSNRGKLREYRAMNVGRGVEVDLLPQFSSFPQFSEDAPTFAENAAGKALHYSRLVEEIVFADDSGLVVPALGGAPGVRSARYAGADASDEQRVAKLLDEMRGKTGDARAARFICVIAAARQGRMLMVISRAAEGVIAGAPCGRTGFGYDPVLYFPPRKRTFAELTEADKNEVSHRGQAFRKLIETLLHVRSTESS